MYWGIVETLSPKVTAVAKNDISALQEQGMVVSRVTCKTHGRWNTANDLSNGVDFTASGETETGLAGRETAE
jgi:hypothetical protein